jgi:ABC-type microcin C transport system duplicated ATPase subunit YejF
MTRKDEDVARKLLNACLKMYYHGEVIFDAEDLQERITQAIRTVREATIADIYEKVMALDNRCGTPTTMQYDVRNIIERSLKAKS